MHKRLFRLGLDSVFLLCLVLFLAGKPATHSTRELKPEEIYQHLLPSVMTLEVEAKDGHKSGGTAFLALREGLAITAWHVVAGAVKVSAKFSDDQVFEAIGIVDTDREKDLALIKLNLKGRTFCQLCAPNPPVGSRAYVIGSPREFEFSISDGLISQVRTLEGYKQYQFTCPVSPGTSGGPVVNPQGQVIGVVSWSRKNSQNLNFAVPAGYVLALNPARPAVRWSAAAPSQSKPTPSHAAGAELN